MSVTTISRSGRPGLFLRKGILKICSRFTGEHPCRSVISIKLLCNPVEIALQHGCSPVNLLHIFRTPFLKNTSVRPLLNILKKKDVHVQVKLTFFYIFIKLYFLVMERKFGAHPQRLDLNIFGLLSFRFMDKGFHGSIIIFNLVTFIHSDLVSRGSFFVL